MIVLVPVNRTNGWTISRDEARLLEMVEWYEEHVDEKLQDRYWQTVVCFSFYFPEKHSEDALVFKLKFGL